MWDVGHFRQVKLTVSLSCCFMFTIRPRINSHINSITRPFSFMGKRRLLDCCYAALAAQYAKADSASSCGPRKHIGGLLWADATVAAVSTTSVGRGLLPWLILGGPHLGWALSDSNRHLQTPAEP